MSKLLQLWHDRFEPSQPSNLHLIVVGAGALALGFYLGFKFSSSVNALLVEYQNQNQSQSQSQSNKNQQTKSQECIQVDLHADVYKDFKMVLLVRMDLKMGKGKIAAQCSHASVGLYKRISKFSPKALARWESSSQVKVVLKIDDENEMITLKEKAKEKGLPAFAIIDSGRTQILPGSTPNSKTVLAIIGPEQMVDEITGHLKLL